jgi:uncharacterized repeat protein (TIGR01451 family)
VTFGLTLSANLRAAPTLSGLPAGATYSYNSQHRRRDLHRHADDAGLGCLGRPDHGELHAAGLRNLHGHGHDQRHDARSESGQQHRHRHDHRIGRGRSRQCVTFPASVNAGQPVSGTVTYTNNGPSSASGVTFGLTLSPNLSPAPTLSGLPAGATYSYNSSTGV